MQAKCIVGDMEVGNTERKSFLIVLGTERFFLASWLRKSREMVLKSHRGLDWKIILDLFLGLFSVFKMVAREDPGV